MLGGLSFREIVSFAAPRPFKTELGLMGELSTLQLDMMCGS